MQDANRSFSRSGSQMEIWEPAKNGNLETSQCRISVFIVTHLWFESSLCEILRNGQSLLRSPALQYYVVLQNSVLWYVYRNLVVIELHTFPTLRETNHGVAGG